MKTHRYVVIAGLVILSILAIPIASAGFFDWFNSITGWASFGNTTLTIDVGNNDPFVANITLVNSTPIYPSENTVTYIQVYIIVNDTDGKANLEGSASVAVNFSYAGHGSYLISSTKRTNESCARLSTDLGSNSKNYSCTIPIYWFDPASAEWNITARVTDINGATNWTQVGGITLGAVQGLQVGPDNITWPQLTLGAWNQTSNQNLTLNNTGNTNFTGLNVTGIDLLKDGTSDTYKIKADNFSISASYYWRCLHNGTNEVTNQTINGTAVTIANSTLPIGNYSIADESTGQEVLYMCLRQVPEDITSGTYTAPADDAWVITGLTS